MMKTPTLCCFVVAVIVASLGYCSGQRNVNIDWNGITHNSRNGRHKTNVNVQNVNYRYNGNRWNANARHNFINRQTNINANYRKNHNFGVTHNSRNRQTNVGYKWNFGRRRRSTSDKEHEEQDLVKMENDPVTFLKRLDLSVKQFVESHATTVPSLARLTVRLPSDSDNVISNVTAAKEVVCLIEKLGRIMPKSLGNFIVRMIKFHGPSYNINDLGDFFTIDGDNGENVNDDEEFCDVSHIQADGTENTLEYSELFEIKKFVASLITVAMEYQQNLES